MKLTEHIQILKKSVKLLFELSRTYALCLIGNSVIGAILPYVPIYFSARLIDALYGGAAMGSLAVYVGLTIGIVFALNLLNAYISSRRSWAQGELYRNQNWKYSEKAMQLAYESIEDREVANLREKIKIESQTGYNLFYLFRYADGLIRNCLKIVMSLALTMSFFRVESIPLSMKCVFVAGVLLSTVCGMYTTKKCERLNNNYWEVCADANMLSGKFYEYMDDYSSGKDIRLYDMAGDLADLSRGVYEKLFILQYRKDIRQSAIKLLDVVMNHLLKFVTYMILIYAALAGGITVGSIAQYVSCLMLMLTAISSLVSNVQLMFANNVYLKRYFSYFEIPNNMYQGSLTVEKRDDNEYFVEFRNVSFKYPGTDGYALKNVNIKFKVGEKLAIVGMNGSGKTTFIKLMCRLYDPTEGEILLNGVDIKKYDYDEYMSIFSVVFQDFGLMAFSLGQNVAASAEYDERKARTCLERAGFGERLAGMSDGLETCLYKHYDKKGIEISGGEAQKIALARALYKDAPFIILDEPTAALDPIAEYEIYSKFNSIVGDKTAIYISHRLASCRFCDNILVFDSGNIVQHGNHSSLLSQENGKYYELWNAQAQYYAR